MILLWIATMRMWRNKKPGKGCWREVHWTWTILEGVSWCVQSSCLKRGYWSQRKVHWTWTFNVGSWKTRIYGWQVRSGELGFQLAVSTTVGIFPRGIEWLAFETRLFFQSFFLRHAHFYGERDGWYIIL